jgi:hypothetical protein
MTRHVKKVARFFVMQLPARRIPVAKDTTMISNEQRRFWYRQIDSRVSKVRLRILPAFNRRRRNHFHFLLTLQSLVLGNATGMLLSRTFRPIPLLSRTFRPIPLLSRSFRPIPLETTCRTPSHMDHIPATDLVDSAWSSILAPMAIHTRNLIKYRRIHHHMLGFRLVLRLVFTVLFRAARESLLIQSLIYSTANYWRVIMRIRRINFHQSRTGTRFDLHPMSDVDFGYSHLHVYRTKMLDVPSPSNQFQCFRCLKTSPVAQCASVVSFHVIVLPFSSLTRVRPSL